MFISPGLIYLEMPKTASTHTRRLIGRYEAGELRRKHGPLTADAGSRLVACSVRDPWDWYVSLWAFGCRGRGALYRRATGRQHLKALAKSVRDRRADGVLAAAAGAAWSLRLGSETRTWRRAYADPHDPALFRQWLGMLLDDRGKALFPGAYGRSGTRQCAGPMTHLFLSLATAHDAWRREGQTITRADALAAFADRHCVLDRTIRFERLEEDLAGLLVELGHDVGVETLRAAGKANVSDRSGVGDYYDAGTAALVARHERLLIERYGYSPPV